MNKYKTSKTITPEKKEFIPGDSAYNRLYPAPQYLPRKLAILILLILVLGLLIPLIADIFKVIN